MKYHPVIIQCRKSHISTISILAVRKSKKYMSKVHIMLVAFKDVHIAMGLFTVFVTKITVFMSH